MRRFQEYEVNAESSSSGTNETLPGLWEWHVKRLAASIEVAGRELGFAPADRRLVIMAGMQEYRQRLRLT